MKSYNTVLNTETINTHETSYKHHISVTLSHSCHTLKGTSLHSHKHVTHFPLTQRDHLICPTFTWETISFTELYNYYLILL